MPVVVCELEKVSGTQGMRGTRQQGALGISACGLRTAVCTVVLTARFCKCVPPHSRNVPGLQ